MDSARRQAVRLLRVMMAASVVLPALLFALTAWLNYQSLAKQTDERLERSLDVLHEHSLRVLQTIQVAFKEVDATIRGMSDDDIRAHELAEHQQLKQLIQIMPRILGIIIIDRRGHPLVYSNSMPVLKSVNLADRDYFRALQRGGHDAGIYVSTIITPRLGGPRRFISLAEARLSDDGKFNGIISLGVRMKYFETFYARLATQVATEGTFFP